MSNEERKEAIKELRGLTFESLSDMLNSEDSEERELAYKIIKRGIDHEAEKSRMKRLYYAGAKKRAEEMLNQLRARHS